MERWDIYDINKHKTGRTMARNDWTMQPGDYHLTVLGIVTNKAGQFLITRRKMDKEWAPGAFEVSGGGVQAGETSLEAVKREVSEETGLDVSRAEISLLHTYRNDSPRERNNYFVDIYHICLDFTPEDVHPQESETDGFRLADYEEIKRLGEAGQFLRETRAVPVNLPSLPGVQPRVDKLKGAGGVLPLCEMI